MERPETQPPFAFSRTEDANEIEQCWEADRFACPDCRELEWQLLLGAMESIARSMWGVGKSFRRKASP